MSPRHPFHVFPLLLLAMSVSASGESKVQEIRGYEIKDSGYIGRPSRVQQDIHWLDNDRIVFIGARPGDYVEPAPGVKEIRYGLYIWNLKSKNVTRHHKEDIANGELCVFRGYLRLGYTADYHRSPVVQRWYVLEGPVGRETLRLVDEETREKMRKHERISNRHTCREYSRSELPPLGYRVIPQLDGEYTSQEREPQPGEVVPWKYWPREGVPVLLNMTREPIGIERYSEYRDTYVLHESPRNYVFGDSVVRRWWLLSRNGRIQDFTPPSGPWMRGSTFVMPTKRGLFLISHAVAAGGNGAAGGYLMENGRLKRVIEGLPASFGVSSSGCQIAIAVSQWDRNTPLTPQVKVVNVCSKGS